MSLMITVRMDHRMRERVRRLAYQRETSVQQMLMTMLERELKYLDRPESDPGRPGTSGNRGNSD